MTLPPLLLRRLAKLLLGLFLFGIGTSLMVRANLGLAPWDVLAQGMARATGWSFGAVIVLIGAGVLLLWWPLRQKPGLGTVLNMLLNFATEYLYDRLVVFRGSIDTGAKRH